MVTLSSFYVHIYRAFLIFTIVINIMGILILEFLIPEKVALTYDLTFSIILIISCAIILIISLYWSSVQYDKKNKILSIKNLNRKFIINNNDIIKVERSFIFMCKIIYKEEVSKTSKSIVFLPSLREFFPLTDYPQRIRGLIMDKSNL